MKVIFDSMHCKRCGEVWSPPPPPSEVQRTIDEHKTKCSQRDSLTIK